MSRDYTEKEKAFIKMIADYLINVVVPLARKIGIKIK